jgi:hypothetical protein
LPWSVATLADRVTICAKIGPGAIATSFRWTRPARGEDPKRWSPTVQTVTRIEFGGGQPRKKGRVPGPDRHVARVDSGRCVAGGSEQFKPAFVVGRLWRWRVGMTDQAVG